MGTTLKILTPEVVRVEFSFTCAQVTYVLNNWDEVLSGVLVILQWIAICFVFSLSLMANAAPIDASTEIQTPTAEQIRDAMKSQLPSPPEGFGWQLYKNAVFLKPVKWTEREATNKMLGLSYTVYATSGEKFSTTQQFEMGFTIEIMTGSQRVHGFEAKKMLFVYIKPIMDKHKKEDVLMFEQSTQVDFERTFFRYRDAPPGLKPIIVHKFIVANNVTDSLHIFTFESPEESWSENWVKYGTPILSKVTIVPNFSAN